MIQQSHFWGKEFPKESDAGSWRDIFIPMFTAALFHNSQKVGATQVSINRWMDKQNVSQKDASRWGPHSGQFREKENEVVGSRACGVGGWGAII